MQQTSSIFSEDALSLDSFLIDSHCHLDAEEFDSDRDEVFERARAAGVRKILVPATTRNRWSGLARLCARIPGLYAAYGLHPMFLQEHQPSDHLELDDFIREHPICAIGECGLDFYVPGLDQVQQLELLRPQLQLARKRNLPVILHAHHALDPLLAEVRRVGNLRGIVHSFSGSAEQARQWCRQGFLLGFGGPVTYPRAKRLQSVVTNLPLQHLVLESDAPDQPLFGYQGMRNEPVLLLNILQQVAKLRNQDAARIAEASTANILKIFQLP